MAATFLVAAAQTPEDIIRVRTRVVFLDALVKDKRTGVPVSDLKLENFEVLDDSKPRSISYFTREGQARKPLALVLILDLRDDGAGRFLKRPEILKSMADELAKLPPEDEVGILAINMNSVDDKSAAIRSGKAIWLTEFSRDRGALVTALARVPKFVEPLTEEEKAAKEKAEKEKQNKGSMTVSADTERDLRDQAAQSTDKPKADDVLETETIKGKNGAVITRNVMKDGSVNVKRVSSDGHMTVEFDDLYDMAAAVRDAANAAQQQRPNSQPSIVWISDGIAPIFFEDRDATEQLLIRDNVIFNSLTVDLRTLFKFLLPIGKPIAGWMGLSLYGAAKQLAQRSGGEAVRVGRVSDYGAGLAKIVGNLTARYNLGFSLAESEKDDGRMHSLDVRVKAQDQKGKIRKLEVSARRGYYMPTESKESTASRAQ